MAKYTLAVFKRELDALISKAHSEGLTNKQVRRVVGKYYPLSGRFP
jgi:hypothetical protein